ncbi:hypothetical protein U1Q18_047393 [Sarracenia purpurea var. burkii]
MAMVKRQVHAFSRMISIRGSDGRLYRAYARQRHRRHDGAERVLWMIVSMRSNVNVIFTPSTNSNSIRTAGRCVEQVHDNEFNLVSAVRDSVVEWKGGVGYDA